MSARFTNYNYFITVSVNTCGSEPGCHHEVNTTVHFNKFAGKNLIQSLWLLFSITFSSDKNFNYVIILNTFFNRGLV